MFFFEKKNQKTFAYWARLAGNRVASFLLPRPRLQQRQVLLRQIGGRRVGRQVRRVLPIGAGAGEIAQALADDAALQKPVRVFRVEREGGRDVGPREVELVQAAIGGGPQDQGVRALRIQFQRMGQIVGGLGIMGQSNSGSSGDRESAALAEA
jgi:hypothetical protein